MASPYTQGRYAILNPDKYIGNSTPKYRSGWELTFMRFCDNHPGVINWASESLRIPYINPFTGKQTTYFRRFCRVYQQREWWSLGSECRISSQWKTRRTKRAGSKLVFNPHPNHQCSRLPQVRKRLRKIQAEY